MNKNHINYALKQWAAKKGKVRDNYDVMQEIDFSTIKKDKNRYRFYMPDGYRLTYVRVDYNFCINLPFKDKTHKEQYFNALVSKFIKKDDMSNIFEIHNATIAQRLEAYYESRSK